MIQCKKTSILGGHYHNYREMFYIVEGKASFELQDVDTNEKVNTELLAGDIMILAPRIAHKVLMEEGTFSLEATEKSYISPEMNDVKYEVNLY